MFLKNLITRLKGFFLIGTIMFCLAICIHNRASAHEWKAPKDAVQKKNPIKSTKTSIDPGKKIYIQFCADCHGKKVDGNGSMAAELKIKPPDLKNRAKYHSDGDLFWKIQNGKGEMPPFREELQEQEIWNVINYIKSLPE